MTDRRGQTRLRAAVPTLVALLVLALGACAPAPSATPAASSPVAPTTIPTLLPTEMPAPPTAASTTLATGISGATPCTAANLKASHGIVEGAAGSTLTSVLLVADGTCSIDAFPAFDLRDANRVELVGSAAGGSGRIDLDAEASYESAVRFGNWCGTDPAFPLALELRIGAEEVEVTGSSFPDEGEMPPCNGGGGPVLEASAWAASP